MGTGLCLRRHALWHAAAIKLRAIEIALSRVVRRGAEVEPAALLVDTRHVRDIGVELGDELAVAAFARHAVDMLKAVALAHPQERLAAIDPRHFLDDVDPALGLVAEHALDRAALDVGGQEVVAILLPVELLNRHGVGVNPTDASEIGVTRIPFGLDPLRGPALGADHADARRGVGRTGLRVGDLRDDGIERVGVVDQREDADTRGVELPVDQRPAVRAPAKAVADAELFFVDPVGGAVDEVF